MYQTDLSLLPTKMQETLANSATLIQQVAALPDDLKFTPVRGKQPISDAWQDNPLTKEQVIARIESDRTITGVGVLCGVPSSGYLFLDHDGASCDELIESLTGQSLEDALPETVSFTSGKEGRRQEIYKVPEVFWDGIRTKKIKTGQIGIDKKKEQLEFRWTGCQSVIHGIHPETEKPYFFINPFSSTAIATAPQWMLEQMIKLPELPKVDYKAKDREPSLTDILEALGFVEPDDYDVWTSVGMALHSQSIDLLGVWEAWSQSSEKYAAGECAAKWDGFSVDGNINIWKLFQLAKQAGYVCPDKLKAQLKATANGKETKLTESIVGEELSEIWASSVLFDSCTHMFRIYVDGVWKLTAETAIKAMIMQHLSVHPKLQNGYSASFVAGIKTLLESLLMCSDWDVVSNDFVPLRNGVFNSETKTLTPHCPGNRLTWKLSFDYDPKATCPLTEKFLQKSLGDAVPVWNAFATLLLLGRAAKAQRLINLYGSGGTGKSVLSSLLQSLVGFENICTMGIEALESGRFSTALLKDRRLFLLPEWSANYHGSVVNLKAITSGLDTIPFEQKMKNAGTPFIFAGGTLIIGNSAISSDDKTSGLSRRIISIEFTDKNIIPLADRDFNLAEKLKTESSGYFNLLMAIDAASAAELVQEASSARSTRLASSRANSLKSSSTLADWSETHLVIDAQIQTLVGCKSQYKTELQDIKTLYAHYHEYSVMTGGGAISAKGFAEQLKSLLNEQCNHKCVSVSRTNQGSIVKGVGIRGNCPELAEAPRPISREPSLMTADDVNQISGYQRN